MSYSKLYFSRSHATYSIYKNIWFDAWIYHIKCFIKNVIQFYFYYTISQSVGQDSGGFNDLFHTLIGIEKFILPFFDLGFRIIINCATLSVFQCFFALIMAEVRLSSSVICAAFASSFSRAF